MYSPYERLSYEYPRFKYEAETCEQWKKEVQFRINNHPIHTRYVIPRPMSYQENFTHEQLLLMKISIESVPLEAMYDARLPVNLIAETMLKDLDIAKIPYHWDYIENTTVIIPWRTAFERTMITKMVYLPIQIEGKRMQRKVCTTFESVPFLVERTKARTCVLGHPFASIYVKTIEMFASFGVEMVLYSEERTTMTHLAYEYFHHIYPEETQKDLTQMKKDELNATIEEVARYLRPDNVR